MKVSLPATMLAVLIAFGLAACGSGSSATESESGTTAAEASPAETQEAEGTKPSGESERPSGGDSGKDDSPSDGESAEGSDGEGSGSAGGGSGSGKAQSQENGKRKGTAPPSSGPPAASEIPEFGREADSSDREAASAVVEGFLNAREDGDWETFCNLLSSRIVESVEKLAQENPKFKGKACVAIFSTAANAGELQKEKSNLQGSISSLRIEADQGFAIYQAGDGEYSILLVREGSDWRVDSPEPQKIP